MRRRLALSLCFAAVAAGAAFADPASDTAYWKNAILAALKPNAAYPSAAQWGHQEGIVLVRFVIDRQGHLQGVEIAKTSGWPELDAQALKMIVEAPLPPAPSDVPGDKFDFTIPIRYRMP